MIVDEYAKTPRIAIQKLLSGRGHFVFYHDLGLKSLLKKEHLEKEVQILPVSFLTYYHYAAFSKHVSKETIDRVKNSLNELNHNNELTKIFRKFS